MEDGEWRTEGRGQRSDGGGRESDLGFPFSAFRFSSLPLKSHKK
jgi:hypothetical protein